MCKNVNKRDEFVTIFLHRGGDVDEGMLDQYWNTACVLFLEAVLVRRFVTGVGIGVGLSSVQDSQQEALKISAAVRAQRVLQCHVELLQIHFLNGLQVQLYRRYQALMLSL